MLQKKAAAKGFHQGLTWEGVSSQKEKCVTVKSSKAYTPEASALGHSHRKTPSHAKASEARQLPRVTDGKQNPG